MEKNNQIDELLVTFLANEVNSEDRQTAVSWINASDDNYRYFESFKKAWQLADTKRTLDYVLDEMDVNEKWQHFKQAVTAEEARIIPLGQNELGEEPLAEELQARPSRLKRYLVPLSAAASVILIIAVGWNFIFPHKHQPEIVKSSEASSPDFVNRHIINTTGRDKTVLLPDSSTVVLSDKSELLYVEPFIKSRDITLIGKGYFKVKKDKTRPFTITSDAITTTALGTAFSVTAYKNASNITVRLFEGKVVVKAVNRSNPRLQKDVYLLPGQEYIYSNDKDGVLRSFAVKNKNSSERTKPGPLLEDNPFIQDDKGSWYMFNNQSLAQVFDELATLYNVNIIYNKKDVLHIYFTARYNKTDSLETILTRIGKLNKLTIVKNDTAFIISQ